MNASKGFPVYSEGYGSDDFLPFDSTTSFVFSDPFALFDQVFGGGKNQINYLFY